MLLASAAVATVLAAAVAGLLTEIDELRDASRVAQRSEQALAAASRLQGLAGELQTGVRGFAISGDERFLEPWTSARGAIPAQVRELRGLVVDPVQRSRVDQLDRAIRAYAEEVGERHVAAARRSPAEGRRLIAGGEGRRRLEAIRAGFDAFEGRQRLLTEARTATAADRAREAILVGAILLGSSVVLVFLFAFYLSRAIVRPVTRLAGAAERVAGGDLGLRVPERGGGEIGDLARGFNVMVGALEENRTELETQNTELEQQAAELEQQQLELAEEKELVQRFLDFGAAIMAETDVDDVARVALVRLAEFAEAEAATLTVAEIGGDGFRLAAAVGPADARVAPHLELPLEHGGRHIGSIRLVRAAEPTFAPAEVTALEHLAGQATVALANSLALAEAYRLAGLNRAVLDNAVDGIALFDLDGNLIIGNPAFARLLRDPHGLANSVRPRDQAKTVAALTTDPEAYLAGLAAIFADPERTALDEYRLAASGRTFQRYVAPAHDASGTPIGRICILREVTAEREIEQRKSELLSTVSHELRTPLASILGFSELLETRELDAETRSFYIRTIHREARRLTSLINDFLDLERIEQGQFTLDLQTFDLGELVSEQAEVFSGQSDRHRLQVELADDKVEVLGDRGRISQVIANLVSNAIKYSPRGGRVRIAVALRDGFGRVSVSDEGIGIPAEQQRDIFKRFFRVDSSDTRQIGGTGLGLALAREIVETHGGRIGFESAEGAGSTFWFELPHGERRPGARRVLLIEDDLAFASLLREQLAAEGLEAETVATGEEGLARAFEDPPALVCLDIRLGGEFDGWQVLERLKAEPATHAIPVVVCTAGDGHERAAVLGAADFLAKPVSAERLRETLERILPATGRASVLVVDDDPAARRLVIESLARAGVDVREAEDGAVALAAIEASRPDALVLDLAMPEVDGFAVLEALAARPELRGIPVVVLTGRDLSREERAALSERAVSLLEKSTYSAVELRVAVRRALEFAPES